MSEQRVPIQEAADLIKVGEALPFRVLDSLERLLLNEGQVIASARQMELLIERGAWVERSLVEERRAQRERAGGGRIGVVRHATLFDRWEKALWDLDSVLRRTAKGQGTLADWEARVDELLSLVDRDADVAIYGAVRQEDRRFALYPLAHSLHAAVLCVAGMRQAQWDLPRQRSVVAAALSMNVAMMELQAQMAEQDTPPTQRQLDTIRAHPAAAVKLLQALGVADAAWLRAVMEHHERADGSGYPHALREVSEEARVLRMADVYMAKITPRASRDPLAPQVASRQLFQQEPGAPLAMAMIKAIGLHPPGSLVQLKTGEVAVVKRRSASGGPAPIVLTVSDARGQPSVNSRELDSAEPAHAIAGPASEPRRFGRILAERVYGLLPP